MATYTALYLQSVYDIALQVYGDASKSFTVLQDNNLGFDDIISQGEIITYSPQNEQIRLLKEVEKRNIRFVTGELDIVDTEISFLTTEEGDYLMTESEDYLIS